jgi:hypothetical protein
MFTGTHFNNMMYFRHVTITLSYLMLLQIYADLMVMGVSIPPFRSQGKLFQILDEDWRKSVEIPHS